MTNPMWDTRIQEAQKVQWTVEHFLQKKETGLFTDMEEWERTQFYLNEAIEKLLLTHGKTPEEEAEIVLAILMGYRITIRNDHHIRLALQRAESIFPILNDSILKCYLAVFCYGESFDKEKGHLARRMLKELKQYGTKLEAMEELLESMEEFEEEKWLY